MSDVMDIGTRTQTSTGPAFADAARSEWTKLRSHRAFRRFLIAGAAISIADGILKTSTTLASHDQSVVSHDPTYVSQVGLLLGAIFFAVAGAIAATSDYAKGARRTTSSATQALAAKAAVVAGASFVVGTVASAASFLIGRALLSPHHIGALTALRVVFGGGLFLALVSVLALATGALLRNTVRTISTAMVGLFLAIVFGLSGILAYLPTAAGANLTTASPQGHTLTAATGLLVMIAWVAVFLMGAFAAQRIRDEV